jgi:diaminopimelate decarboxylase
MHIGSGTDLEHLRHVCQAMEKTARDVGRSVIGISAGGGLPVPYRAEESFVDIKEYFNALKEPTTLNLIQNRKECSRFCKKF